MHLADFAALGPFAAAGLRATRLAIGQATESSAAGRIPIAGAAVERRPDGTLRTVTVGCNGRIPADGGPGYPTDHGETGAVRHLHDLSAVPWERVVFATTLSPCIMCTRTLLHLHGLGLSRVVVAEAASFPGRKALLANAGMQLVELTNPDAVTLMQRFARTHPWDWQADIGGIPPRACSCDAPRCACADGPDPAPVLAHLAARGHHAAVVARDGTVVATAADGRAAHGHNPVYSAPMLAIGRAGSAINLREHTLVVAADVPVDIDTFGLSSLGACELFRPQAVVLGAPAAVDLEDAFAAADLVLRSPA
ncbi:MAG: creatinine deaminase [Myxococcota bacterium]|jgi:creatinine deaminase